MIVEKKMDSVFEITLYIRTQMKIIYVTITLFNAKCAIGDSNKLYFSFMNVISIFFKMCLNIFLMIFLLYLLHIK